MNETLWTAVDDYLVDLLVPPDPALATTLESSVAAGLPAIQVTPTQGKFLHLLARISGARKILEVGALGGYSTIWLARALPPDGHLVTLEVNPRNAEVARANIARAGLSDLVELRRGPALDTLPQLESEGRAPFDLVFIDADKQHNPEYFAWALRLSRPGTVIVLDNMVRNGTVIDESSDDGVVQALHRLNDLIAATPQVSATTLQTVGAKGYDGFTLALVNG